MMDEYHASLKPAIARESLDSELQIARACIGRARQGLDKMTPETRMLRLELQHAIGAIERAWLIARGGELEADLPSRPSPAALAPSGAAGLEQALARLLEAALATLDLVAVTKETVPR